MIRLAGFYFAYYLALGAYSPYFAPFLEARGVTAWQISVVMSLWYGTRVFAPSAWAHASARRGSAAAWLRAGCVLTLLAFALFLLPLRFAGLLLVMLLFASVYNAVLPQFEAITLEHLGSQRGRYARIRLWGSVGFLLANLGYGLALKLLGYDQLVWLMLPAFGLLVLAAWLAPTAPMAAAALASPSAYAESLPALRPEIRRLLLIAFLMQLSHGPLYIYLSLFLAEHGWNAGQIGQFWALGVLAEVAMFYCMPRLLATLSPVWMLAICLAVGGLRWPLLAIYPDTLAVICLAQLLHAFTFAAFHASLMHLVSQDCSGAELRRVQALTYGLGSGGGGVVGAWLAGAVWTWSGHAHAFVAAGVVSVLSLALIPGLRVAQSTAVRHA